MGTTTTTVYRTQATETLIVLTVLVREGRFRFYETTIIIGGKVADGLRTWKKFDAGFEHDAAVAWAKGYRDPSSKRHEFWEKAAVGLAESCPHSVD